MIDGIQEKEILRNPLPLGQTNMEINPVFAVIAVTSSSKSVFGLLASVVLADKSNLETL